jgi:hypothetical protein
MTVLFDRINVREAPFFAKGDGVTDDAPAINAAIKAAGSGGTVYFPPIFDEIGYYLIKSPLIIDYDVGGVIGIHLVGDSAANLEGGVQPQIRAAFTANTGTGASITAVAPDPNGQASAQVVTITGLTGLSGVIQGDMITISTASTVGNNGTFSILSVNSGGGFVTALNTNFDDFQGGNTGNNLAVAPDANDGYIHWQTYPAMVRCWSRGVLFENLFFDANYTAGCVIDSTAPVTLNCTNNQFRNCQLWNAVFGVKIADFGPNALYQGNCDLHEFYECYFNGCSFASVYIPNSTGQSKHHRFDRCYFIDGYYGIYVRDASFSTDHCGLALNTRASFYLGGIDDSIQIRNCDSEQCARLLQTSGINFSPFAVMIDGGRFDVLSSNIAADQQYIQWTLGSGLHVRNCDFSQGVAGLGTFSIGLAGWNVTGVNAVIESCNFPTDTAQGIITKLAGQGPGSAISLGNICQSAANGLIAVPDGQIVTTPSGNVSVTMHPLQILAQSLPAQPWTTVVAGANNDVPRPYNTTVEVTSAYVLGDFNVTGIASGIDGMVLEIYNLTSHVMTLNNENSGSAATNRIHSFSGSDVTGHFVRLRYSAALTSGRWIVTDVL